MSTHLTREELTDLLLGSTTNAVDSHLRVCELCRRELEQMRGSMQAFRTASYGLSESLQTAGPGLPPQIASKPQILRPWMFAVAAAAVLIAVFGEYRLSHHDATQANTHTPAVTTTSQEEIARDNELMSQINSELAEDAPEPMQPLQWTASEVSSTNNKAR